jgi:hypothetical protein
MVDVARDSVHQIGENTVTASSANGLGMLIKCGTSLKSKIEVAIDAGAVNALMPPESQYVGYQIVQISIRCVTPQAMMKIPQQMKIQLKRRSVRLRTK